MRFRFAFIAAAALALPGLAVATPSCTTAGSLTCFFATGNIVTYTVPTTGSYVFLAFGAQGGSSTRNAGYAGGKGAEIGGSFTLQAGDILKIATGGTALAGTFGTGGGGGSFVVVGRTTRPRP